MKTKLTLRMEEDAIERAKAYARHRGTSVSQLVEHFFHALEHNGHAEIPRSPLVESLLGIADPDEDLSEEHYLRHLEEKHR